MFKNKPVTLRRLDLVCDPSSSSAVIELKRYIKNFQSIQIKCKSTKQK